MSMDIEISSTVQAEKTDLPVDPDVYSTVTNDQDVTIKDSCSSNGSLRRITINGQCYAQMCCGGQWMYFYKDTPNGRLWCTCNLGQSWTVNCAGNNWIINCR
ncbi:hypothetical protein EHN07_06565 [Buttiauxella warmboldiae]|uniref:Uncharacterized protein n=1 Tax=Buttiauxella warmboldiae TaxID=82993 RepID=A0A3N5DNW3_9ENTR|nr:hypothetical protein [Buttiauxella warmboldiae]RPH29307.1 hypothetical protein EHN07_06565 [Buttiauxella warmboldiae]